MTGLSCQRHEEMKSRHHLEEEGRRIGQGKVLKVPGDL